MKGKNSKSADQKKLIALALVGGLVWGGYTLYQKMERHFARLPVMGSVQVASVNQSQDGLTHLAPVQISAGNQTNQALVDSINTKNALKMLNKSAFEPPKPPKEVVQKIESLPVEQDRDDTMTLMERFIASGPHNLLSLVDEEALPKLGVTFPANNMAIINGQIVAVGETVSSFTYEVPDLEGGESAKPIQRSPKLSSVKVGAATLTDEWNGWTQEVVLVMRTTNIPLSGSQEDVMNFFIKVLE